MKIKILLILNDINWLSISDKIKFIKDFFSPKFVLEIDVLYKSFTNIPFEKVKSSSMINGVEVIAEVPAVKADWYNENITSLALDKQIVIFYVGSQSVQGHPAGLKQDNNEGPVELTLFRYEENDIAYQQGSIVLGNAFSVFACHEIAHSLYHLFKVPDNTHKHFYFGNPKDILNDFNISPLNFISVILESIRKALVYMGVIMEKKIENPPAPSPTPPDPLEEWNTPTKARHSARVVMDTYGLTWQEKNLLSAVIMAESGFDINAKNYNKVGGKVVSTDFGICQINDFYHIGEGKYFKSVEEVLTNPAKSVEFMIKQSRAGHLDWWIAFKNQSYLRFL